MIHKTHGTYKRIGNNGLDTGLRLSRIDSQLFAVSAVFKYIKRQTFELERIYWNW